MSKGSSQRPKHIKISTMKEHIELVKSLDKPKPKIKRYKKC